MPWCARLDWLGDLVVTRAAMRLRHGTERQFGVPAWRAPPKGSGSRLRQLRDETHRHAKLVELEVRAEERDRSIRSRLSRNLDDVDSRFGERPLRLDGGRSVLARDVVLNPAVQERVDLRA